MADKWEYKYLDHRCAGLLNSYVDEARFYAELNELGAQGWELVSVMPFTGGGCTRSIAYFFKRRVGGQEPR